MSQILGVPKPLSCSIAGNEAHAVFDREELSFYLSHTEDKILWVEDPTGNRTPIRVEFLRELESGEASS
jgi:hypothetical protein